MRNGDEPDRGRLGRNVRDGRERERQGSTEYLYLHGERVDFFGFETMWSCGCGRPATVALAVA